MSSIDAPVVRPMIGDELPAVSALAMAAFSVQVAPDFSARGIETFSAFAEPDRIEARDADDHFTLVAEADGRLVGMIQMHRPGHVRMLFVLPDMQRRGIARLLMDGALARLGREDEPPESVTVHSSRFAVPIYRQLGFEVTGDTDVTEGVISVPMRRSLLSGPARR